MELSRLQSHVPIDLRSKIIESSSEEIVPVEKLSWGELYQFLQIDPYLSSIALELGVRLRKSGKTEDALQVLEHVVRMDDRFESLIELGLVQYDAELMTSSLRTLQHALMVAPDESVRFPEIFKTIGNIFVRKGDYESAEDAYYKALRLDPNSDVLMVNLGTIEIQRSQWGKALERFRESIALNSKNDKAWVGLAIAHRQFGDFELAWGNIETALSYNPTNESALTLACDWAVKDRKEVRLLELLRDFLVADGWNPSFSLTFVWLSWMHGDRATAQLELERVLTLDPYYIAGWELQERMRSSI